MEAEEDDSSKRDVTSSLYVDDNLNVKCDNHREPQSNEQHCVSKFIPETEESPPNISVESLPPRDSIIEDESFAVDTYSEIEKKDVVDGVEIADAKAFPNILEVLAEDSVESKIDTGMAETAFSEQRVFADVTEDAEAEEKADLSEDKMLNEIVLADVDENQIEGNVLVANFQEITVEEDATRASLVEAAEEAVLIDKTDGETFVETTLSVPDAEVSYVTNLAEMTEVIENADDSDAANDILVPKQDNLAPEDNHSGVPVELTQKAGFSVSSVNENAVEEEEKVNLPEETSDAVKIENVASNSAKVGLTDLLGEITEVVNMENAEDKKVKVDGLCMTDVATEVVTMGSLADETPEVKAMDTADDSVLKIENARDRDTEVQGTSVSDEIAKAREENMVDETAEVMGAEVREDIGEVVSMENVTDNTTELEDVDMVEEQVEEDKIVYLEGETIGSEEADANVTGMVEEIEVADEVEEMDVADEVDEASRGSSGAKRKRGKNSRAPARVPSRKKVEEDVCFICFDGGDLVLCDRRGCPKAYHPSCVNRDEAFFRAKGRWNCGWHLCSSCEKSAHYMCYTCTFSLCKGCIKDAVILCVRGNKGFCETCMRFVTMIEKNEQGSTEKGQIDFNDKSSWEFLFKEYWTELKEKLSLTLDELFQAKNPWKGSETQTSRLDSPGELYDGNFDGGSELDISENEESGNSKKRKAKKRSKSHAKEIISPTILNITSSQGLSTDDNIEWASKELLEFVMHMTNGDKTALSQFDVQALLLEYIKRNKLRDPRRKSQIICDSRLQNLFGKPRVGHFEMLKLLEAHFLIKEDSRTNDLHGVNADTESSQLETDGHTDAITKTRKEKKRKTRKKGDERGLQSNVDDYAAIDIHNINLIYLRRNLVEDLIEDENFHDKVVGCFVRIRISGSAQKQDLYRLVQVVGTSKASEPYKVGKKMTDLLLEILNLNKTEVISVDIISNQEFTEDECKRLRQSIKCGILNRLTVGDIQEKAITLQDVRVKDWIETETVRLSHLRDRASETGRRKEECVEKLQLLKTPEERQRRMEEIPEIHADPKMDPSHESEDEDEVNDKRQETYTVPRGTNFGRRMREPISPGKGSLNSNDSWSGNRNFLSMNRDSSRNSSSRAFSSPGDDAIGSGEIINENSWSHGRDRDAQRSNKWEKQQISPSSEIAARNTLSGAASQLSSAVHSPNPAATPSIGNTQFAAKVDESEKIWRYQDPSGKVQGPFSMVQLRKWSNTGYFPADLRVWRTSDKQEDSLLLTDVLAGKMQKESSLMDNNFQKSEVVHTHHTSFVGKPHGSNLQLGMDGKDSGVAASHTNPISFDQPSGGRRIPEIEVSPIGRPASVSKGVPKYSGDGWSSDYGNKNNFTNLPSPTPSPGGGKEQQSQAAASFLDAKRLSGGNGGLQPSMPDSSMRGSENDSWSLHSSRNALQGHSQPVAAAAPILDNSSVNPAADIKSISANLQSLVQSISSRNPPLDTQGHGSGLVPKRETNTSGSIGNEPQTWENAQSLKVEPIMPAQPPQSRWGEMPPVQNAASSFSAGNATGNFSTPSFSNFPPSDLWRSPTPIPGNQPHIQPSTPSNLPWGMVAPESHSTVPRPGLEPQNQAWGPMPTGNPNMAWNATAPANANVMWGAAAPNSAPPSGNPSWIAPGPGPPAGNTIQGWAAHGPVPPPVNANPGWVASGLGPPPPPANMNPSWPVPSGNQAMWGNEHGKNGDRFSNHRDSSSHGGDSVGGGKSWGMQSSYGGGGGGGSSRPPYKGQRLCKYYESGRCRKGASCDYMHN